tara:strand:+ start:4181 stop:4351 length:171 start_codon:yes stop_codon:yes gene_type:complete
VFEANIWQENLNIAFSDKCYIVENQKLNNNIRYFGETGGFDLLFLKKHRFYSLQNV